VIGIEKGVINKQYQTKRPPICWWSGLSQFKLFLFKYQCYSSI